MPRSTKPSKSTVRNLLELVLTVAVAIGLALGIQAFLVKPYRIPSLSMFPTLEQGQRILVNRLDPTPSLYNVVVFHPPAGADPSVPVCGNPSQGAGDSRPCDTPTATESQQTFVKRVVGLPGDHLHIVNGHVWCNGSEEKGSYIQPCPVAQDCTFRRPSSFQPGTTT
jgi:signal peptidase I